MSRWHNSPHKSTGSEWKLKITLYQFYGSEFNDHIILFNMESILFIDLQSLGPSSVSSQGETLKHLVLSKNKLSAVPTQAIRHLRNLEHLNLNENQIITIENEAFMGLNKVLCYTAD